jgi:uncharacterized SAM-binding protein YcdF (DUF218 family)
VLFVLKWAIRVFIALMAIMILYIGITAAQVWMTSRQHFDGHADAILVFGTAEYDGVPSPDLKARLDQALDLYRAGRAPLVAVTGGRLAGDVYTEAEVSSAYLREHGVPASAIISGGGSDSYENVQSVAPQLNQHGVKTVLVATDPFHEDRAMAVASTFGFSPSPDPTQTSPITGWATVPYFIRETFAVAAGRLVGYGTLSQLLHP